MTPKTIGDFHQNRLTTGDEAREAQIRSTFPGMAHIGGTGPADKTCRECQRWTEDAYGKRQPAEYNQIHTLKGATCGRFIAMMGRVLQGSPPKVPHDAAACQFFEPAEHAPPIKEPK